MRRDTMRMNRRRPSVAVEVSAVEAPPASRTGNSVVVGSALIVYAVLLLLASYALWSYAENLFLWAWLYHLVKLVRYTPYALALKGLSVAVGFLGLLALLASLALIVDGVIRQRSERRD